MPTAKDINGQGSTITSDEIIWVDDDQFLLARGEIYFNSSGMRVIKVLTVADVDGLINGSPAVKAIILDVMMPPGHFTELAAMGGFRTGLLLANSIKKNYPHLAIIVYTAHSTDSIAEEIDRKSFHIFSKMDLSLKDLAREVRMIVSGENWKPQCFIVHGHNTSLVADLKNYLQNTLKFPEPIVLCEQPKGGKTIIEAFEESARSIDLVFVLLTPDDIAAPSAEPDDKKSRARQNVIFETGYFYKAFGRKSGRVILLHQGVCELPSDIHGVAHIDVTHGVEKAGEKIRKEITAALNWPH